MVSWEVNGVAIRGHPCRRPLADLGANVQRIGTVIKAAITLFYRAITVRVKAIKTAKSPISVTREKCVILIGRMKRNVPAISS